jgi:hypothetical protein
VLDFTDEGNVTNKPVIENIPGSSGSMAISPSGDLFVGVGSGDEPGHLRAFSLAAVENAYNTSNPLDWTDGALFNSVSNNSAFGLFFDARGYLFAGGPDGITVFDPSGTAVVYENTFYTSIDYDAENDLVLVTGYGLHRGLYPASMFQVPEPATFVLAFGWFVVVLAFARRRVRRRARVAG